MIFSFLIAVVCGAAVYFLFNYLDSVLKNTDFFRNEDSRILTIAMAVIAGFCAGEPLNQKLTLLVPPESYEETEKHPLSSFVEGGDVYAVIEKEDVVFLENGKLARRKYDEINEDVSFLPEDRMVPPQLIRLKAKRSGFWKYFFIDPDKLKFFVPCSGIKKGEIKFVEMYKFISEK